MITYYHSSLISRIKSVCFILFAFTILIGCKKKNQQPDTSNFTLTLSETDGGFMLNWPAYNSEEFVSYSIQRLTIVEPVKDNSVFTNISEISDFKITNQKVLEPEIASDLYYRIQVHLKYGSIYSNIVHANSSQNFMEGNFSHIKHFPEINRVYILHNGSMSDQVTEYDYQQNKKVRTIAINGSIFNQLKFGLYEGIPFGVLFDYDNQQIELKEADNFNTVQTIQIPSSINIQSIIGVMNDGNLLLESYSKIYTFEIKSQTMIHEALVGNASNFTPVFNSSKSILYLATSNEIVRFNYSNGVLTPVNSIIGPTYYIEDEYLVASSHGKYIGIDINNTPILNDQFQIIGNFANYFPGTAYLRTYCFSEDENYIFGFSKDDNLIVNKASDCTFYKKLPSVYSNSTNNFIFESNHIIYGIYNTIFEHKDFRIGVKKYNIDF